MTKTKIVTLPKPIVLTKPAKPTIVTSEPMLYPDFFPELWAKYGAVIVATEATVAEAAAEVAAEFRNLVPARDVPWWTA